MTELTPFIEQARGKGLNDEDIRKALTAQGWNEAAIEFGLKGLEIPKPRQEPVVLEPKVAPKDTRPSISPLMAALHHVLLWFFTGSSTVTIIGVMASLAGVEVSTQALAAMIAVTVITFTPYAAFFISFLRQAAKTPGLVPGKAWSIISICLHSIGAMIAAITLVVTAITGGEMYILTSAALVLVLGLLVVVTYCTAAFATSDKATALRKVVTRSYLPILAVLFGVLFVLSLMQLGPARHDEQLRKDLATTVQHINQYARDHHQLPSELGSLSASSEIEYTLKADATYEVCATFQTASKNQSNDRYTPDVAPSDSYVSETSFYPAHTGRNCFTFSSSVIGSGANFLNAKLRTSIQ